MKLLYWCDYYYIITRYVNSHNHLYLLCNYFYYGFIQNRVVINQDDDTFWKQWITHQIIIEHRILTATFFETIIRWAKYNYTDTGSLIFILHVLIFDTPCISPSAVNCGLTDCYLGLFCVTTAIRKENTLLQLIKR